MILIESAIILILIVEPSSIPHEQRQFLAVSMMFTNVVSIIRIAEIASENLHPRPWTPRAHRCYLLRNLIIIIIRSQTLLK